MTWIPAAIVAYLIGSLSGARILGRRWAPGDDLSSTKIVLDGTGASVTTSGVSPSSLQARAGAQGGLRAALFDILKAFLPTLAARLIWGEGPEEVLVAAAVLVGHVYPVYHRFVGGFGISPLIGSLLVIDVWAAVASIAAFGALGIALGSAYVGIEIWPLGLLPWFALRGDPWEFGYALLANLLFWWRSRAEAVAAFRAWRADARSWSARIKDFRTYPDYEVPDP